MSASARSLRGPLRTLVAVVAVSLTACDANSPLVARGNQIGAKIIERYKAEMRIISAPVKDIAGEGCIRICEYFAYSIIPGIDRKLHDSEWALVFYNSSNTAYAILISSDGEMAYSRSTAPRTDGCISCNLKFHFGGLHLKIE